MHTIVFRSAKLMLLVQKLTNYFAVGNHNGAKKVAYQFRQLFTRYFRILDKQYNCIYGYKTKQDTSKKNIDSNITILYDDPFILLCYVCDELIKNNIKIQLSSKNIVVLNDIFGTLWSLICFSNICIDHILEITVKMMKKFIVGDILVSNEHINKTTFAEYKYTLGRAIYIQNDCIVFYNTNSFDDDLPDTTALVNFMDKTHINHDTLSVIKTCAEKTKNGYRLLFM